MPIDLPLESFTVAEKLAALEAIWSSLSANPADVASPAWHATVLEERRQRLKSGQATVSDWDSAKKRVQKLGQ